mgnify:CR=1 FL=1
MAFTAIDDPSAYFKVQLYTGNGSANHITLPGDTDMQPDLVWIKERSSTSSHQVTDAVRGVGKHLNSDDAAAEGTNADRVQAFNSDGFQIGTDSSVNQDTITHAAWCWKAGTTSGITTNGSTDITPSAYSFNQTAGFSIIQYTGNDTANQQIAHGLGVAPHQIIVKSSSNSANWAVYNIGVNGGSSPEDYALELNTSDAKEDEAGFWNDTVPDTVNFTVDRDGRTNN